MFAGGNGDEKCEKLIEKLNMVEVLDQIALYAKEELAVEGIPD